jgi:LacI family transcriptional regulator
MPVTIRDIAKKLGLSIGAVSRALDGYADISEETRQRVIRTAHEMDYVPNRAARQLRRKKADSLGYILPGNSPHFADPFFSEFIAGLGDETAQHPFDLVVSIAPPGEEQEKHLYQNWVQGCKVDGFILTHMHLHDWRAQYLWEHHVPFSALENMRDGNDFSRVDVDWQAGIVKLMAHLLANGYRRIAYLGGPVTLTMQASQLNGYHLGLQDANLPYDDQLVVSGDLTSAGGYEAAKRLLAVTDPVDAIMCINDETAFGALRAAHEMGYEIGRNLAVAGFDGVQDAKYMEPPLTTLDISIYEIAHLLVGMLVAEIEQKTSYERRYEIQPRLVIRESTERKHA